MALPDYVEIIYESRELELGISTLEKNLVLSICLDPDDLDATSADSSNAVAWNDQSDDVKALELAYTYLPAYVQLPNAFGQLYLLILSNIKTKQVGPTEYRIEGKYEYNADQGKGGERPGEGNVSLEYIKINFNIGGGTRRITQSKEITSTALTDSPTFDAWLASAPPVDNAIGATEDEVVGAEIPDNVLRVQITGYFLPDYIDLDFMNALKAMVPTTNDDVFLGAAAGELLLTAVSGGGSVVDIIPITFDFLVGENLSAVSDPPFTSLTMTAHEILDYKYLPVYDDTSKTLLRLPQVRYTHRVFEESDFDTLGLPS